jgi:hypothetical protein
VPLSTVSDPISGLLHAVISVSMTTLGDVGSLLDRCSAAASHISSDGGGRSAAVGFHKHLVLNCHTCKRRRISGGPKKGGSYREAERVGWVMMVRSTLGDFIWLCPNCAHKHASTELPVSGPPKKQ